MLILSTLYQTVKFSHVEAALLHNVFIFGTWKLSFISLFSFKLKLPWYYYYISHWVEDRLKLKIISFLYPHYCWLVSDDFKIKFPYIFFFILGEL